MKPTAEERDEFIKGVWACMLFTGGAYSDNPNCPKPYCEGNVPPWREKLSKGAADELESDCDGFLGGKGVVKAIRADLGFDKAGNDFHFSRNGHGCGFWDGEWKEPGAQLLDEWAKTFGSFELEREEDGENPYVGPDGKYEITQ